jgi:catechol 2,3-dioxygenase-like lactoylglutathione lyase family enzyme
MTHARELRFAFVFDDHEAALHLFRDVFGLEMLEEFHNQGGRGLILRVPSATLEVFNPEYGQYVDEIEVGRPVDSRVRIAVNVDDLAEAGRGVEAIGVAPEAEPVVTPWGDHNQRFKTRDGLQLTLFQTSTD